MINNKTPITYYGGKQQLAKWIISHFPPHDCYVEPFAGGLAVFFARIRRVKTQVINDTNPFVTNFWQQYRDNASELIRVIEATPYSREENDYCKAIYQGKMPASNLEKARAFFVQCNQTFGSSPANGWCFTSNPNTVRPKVVINKMPLLKSVSYCMKYVEIENIDAIQLIKKWDGPKSFFYLDPPYPGANQGHYSGYTMKDFNKLLTVLRGIRGKFLLSCYLQSGMDVSVDWHLSRRQTLISTQKVSKSLNQKREKRTEALIYNYSLRGKS